MKNAIKKHHFVFCFYLIHTRERFWDCSLESNCPPEEKRKKNDLTSITLEKKKERRFKTVSGPVFHPSWWSQQPSVR